MRERRYDEKELRGLMPSCPAEWPLPGEEAAVAAFRAAHAARSAASAAPAASERPRRFSRRTTALGVAVATLLGGGVAVATAATGHLPFQGGTGEPGPLPTVSSPGEPGDASPAGTGGPSVRESTSGSHGAPGGPSAAGSPSVPTTPERSHAGPENGMTHGGRHHGEGAGAADEGRLDGRCRSYAHKKPEQRKKALDKPAYAPLVDAAGGPEHVNAYCADRGPAAGGPARPGSGHPSAEPHTKSSYAPSARPSEPAS